MRKRTRGPGHHHATHTPHIRLRAVAPVDIDEIPPPLPIYHHPAVALSLILMVAAVVQIGVWILSLKLGSTPAPPASQALVHGLLLDRIAAAVPMERVNGAALVYPVTLTLAMLSGWAWFGIARMAIGPIWGLWVGLAWVVHPAFAIVANRGGALGLEILLTSLLALSLCGWRYGRNPWPAAPVNGIVNGLLALTSTAGIAVFGLAAILTAVVPGNTLRRAAGPMVVVAAFMATVGLFIRFGMTADERSDRQFRMADGFETAVRTAPVFNPQTAPATRPARTAIADFLTSARQSPWAHFRWYLGRFVRTTFTTADRRFERPLMALHILWTMPAIWGAVLAAQHPPWRWLLGLAVCFLLSFWLTAALLEPLARNLTPIGGIGIILGLIGAADVYERFFGRRLLGGVEPAVRAFDR